MQTTTQEYLHICEYCSKKYSFASGLCKHKKKCTNKPKPLETQLLERIAQLETQTINNNITNNTNCNNNNTINIHLTYLNTHCNNAMNIDQFVESVKFIKDDLLEIDRNRFFAQGVTKLLKKRFENLSVELSPIHCSAAEINQPTNFYVRDNDQWTRESQSDLEFNINCGEFEGIEYSKPRMMRFIEKYTQELYEKYLKMLNEDKSWKRLEDKMFISGRSETHIKILREIPDIESLVLDIPSDTNTDTDPNLLTA